MTYLLSTDKKKFEQIPLFYPRGYAVPQRGIAAIAILERFVDYYLSDLITSGRAPGRGPEGTGNCSSCYANSKPQTVRLGVTSFRSGGTGRTGKSFNLPVTRPGSSRAGHNVNFNSLIVTPWLGHIVGHANGTMTTLLVMVRRWRTGMPSPTSPARALTYHARFFTALPSSCRRLLPWGAPRPY